MCMLGNRITHRKALKAAEQDNNCLRLAYCPFLIIPFKGSMKLNLIVYISPLNDQEMNRIQEMLHAKGLKQIQLAEALGVAKSSVSQWCSNTVQPPLAKLNDIADAVGCDVTELIVSKRRSK